VVIEHYETAAWSSWGQRPDGKPYGSWEFPEPLTECPDGLVMFRPTFEDHEVDALRALVASAKYQALRRSGDTTYYRAYWLMRRMGDSLPDQIVTLGQAIWQADGDAAIRRRYLEELTVRARALAPPTDLEGLGLRAWMINALRELGRFAEAEAMLRGTSFNFAVDREGAREVREWRRYYRRLGRLVARRDAAMEPSDWIPRLETARRERERRRGED
jgi:hypothetical protein